jgi:hypothetical protein
VCSHQVALGNNAFGLVTQSQEAYDGSLQLRPFPGTVSIIKNKKVRLTVVPALLVLVLYHWPKRRCFTKDRRRVLTLLMLRMRILIITNWSPRPDPSETVAYKACLHLVTTPQTRLENPTVELMIASVIQMRSGCGFEAEPAKATAEINVANRLASPFMLSLLESKA